MDTPCNFKEELLSEGFAVVENVYTTEEISNILETISQVDTTNSTFRKTKDLFAIRQFLKEVPATKKLIFNDRLSSIISEVFGDDYFAVKSIYFDKPEQSNWFVAYHQDLTVSVEKNWTSKVLVHGQ